jgi:hypothetical protein
MGKSSGPPPPDYAALAAQQGTESRDTAAYNAAINRTNSIGPAGSTTWTIRPGADPQNPKPGDYIQTTALAPAQQALQEGQDRISQQYLGTAEAGLGRVADAMATPFNTSGLPQIDATGKPVVGQLSTQGLPELNYGTTSSRDRVEQALLSRLNPQIEQDRAGLENRLLNSGIEKGTEAWNREMTRSDQAATDARMQAILAGGGEESRQAGLQSAQRSQLFGEQATSGNFANTAARDAIAQALQARGQGVQEQAYLRQLPINEVNALRTGSQVTMPQFGSGSGGYNATAAGGNPLEAGLAQGQFDMSKFQNQQSGQNALLSGLASIASAYLMS